MAFLAELGVQTDQLIKFITNVDQNVSRNGMLSLLLELYKG